MARKKKVVSTPVEAISKAGLNDQQPLEGYLNQNVLLKSEGNVKRVKENDKIYWALHRHFFKALHGLFDYVNLPDSIPSHFIEQMLYERGRVALFMMAGKMYATDFTESGARDLYNNLIEIQPRFPNGFMGPKLVRDETIVIMKNDVDMWPTMSMIDPFVQAMVKNRETHFSRLGSAAAKWFVKVAGTGDLKKVEAIIQRMFDDHGRIVFSTASSDMFSVEPFPFFEEFDSAHLWEDFNNSKNFIFELLGVPNNPQEDKRERLVSSEVEVSQMKLGTILESMVKSRLMAIDKLNELFNANIQLKLYVDYSGEEGENKNEESEGASDEDTTD